MPDLGYFAGLALHSETAPNEEVANKTRTAFTQGKYAVYSFRIQDNSATIPGNQSYLVWCPKWCPFSNDPETIEAVYNRTRQRLGGQTITLAGIDSMAEGHNWDNINNIILTSYTWAADKVVQAINRAHRLTSKHEVNLHVIICDQSADRVLEDNINEKTNSSELAIDGRLLGEATEERSITELLRDAMRDFKDQQDCPNEETLAKIWPALREQLQEAARGWHGIELRPGVQLESNRNPIGIDLSIVFPMPLSKPQNIPSPVPVNLPSWRRVRLAA